MSTAAVEANEISGHFSDNGHGEAGRGFGRGSKKAIDEEVARFLAKGPTAKELERVKAGKLSNFVRSMERIGGFGGKSDILAQSEIWRGNPDFYKTVLNYFHEATGRDVQARRKSG